MSSSSKFFAIIAGVGAGTGRSVSLKFAQTYPTVLLARTPASYDPIVSEIRATSPHPSLGISTDITSPESVANAFEVIKNHPDFGGANLKLAAAVYNAAGGFIRKPFLELTLEDFSAGWNGNGKGGFLFAQETIPLLLESVETSPHPPTLVLTGATASVRGSANCASFANGKFALRALGQSLSREFHPKGVHVAHAIIDGVIDIPRTQSYNVNNNVEGGKISSEAIADAYWWLATQPKSAFTQEIDMRPFVERF